MTFDPIGPWWLLIAIAVVLLAVCVLAAVTGRGWLRWIRRAVLVVAVLGISVQPAVGSTPARAQLSNLDIVVAIDTTPSVNALDWDGTKTRLEGVRSDVEGLVRSLDGARFAVVTFNDVVTEALPFSTDPEAVDSLLSVTEPENDENSGGSSLSRPVRTLHQILADDAKENPTRQRLLVLTSDGEQTNSPAPGSFVSLRPYLSGGAVWGYGTTRGARMYSYDPDAPNTRQYVEGPDGSPGVSHYDPHTLQTAARQLGVPFHHRTQPGGVRAAIALPASSPHVAGTTTVRTGRQLYWILALVLVALTLWEAWSLVVAVDPGRRRVAIDRGAR